MEITLPISIIIPSHNRQCLLTQILPTYFVQGCSEIIIVDDASEPPIDLTLLQQWKSECKPGKLRIRRNPKRLNLPASRMEGTKMSREPYIFFGEDDVSLSPGHIRSLFRAVNSGRIDIAASLWLQTQTVVPVPQIDLDLDTGYSSKDFVNLWECTIKVHKRVASPIFVPWLTSLSLMQRDVVLRLEFDPNFRGNAFREETDFFLRAHCDGARLALVDGPPAFHLKGPRNRSGGVHGGRGLWSFLWYEFWVMRNNYYFLQKNASRLHQIGRRTHPLLDTLLYQMRRTLGYPGRMLSWLRSEVLRFGHEISC